MRVCLGIIATLAAGCMAEAFAANGKSGRSLPSGEDTPLAIEKIYNSPRGELQIASATNAGRAVLLRTNSGAVLSMRELRGPRLCDEWLISDKESNIPQGCEFVFFDEGIGTYFSVLSSEVEETSLFQAVKGRGHKYVAL